MTTGELKTKFFKIVRNFVIRGNDSYGSGAFGASRGGRNHAGIDVVALEGETIFSPIDGTFKRLAPPYLNDSRYSGMVINNSTYEIKIFYIKNTIAVGKIVKAGQPIAVAQNISKKYGTGMINHVHIEVRKNGKLIDPTNLF